MKGVMLGLVTIEGDSEGPETQRIAVRLGDGDVHLLTINYAAAVHEDLGELLIRAGAFEREEDEDQPELLN